jgi:predicted phosphodiesterase
MRILISSDIHSNILACEELAKIYKHEKCDLHITMGDAIDLGPWPNETLEFIKQENLIHLKGNHEEYNCSIGLGPELKKNIGKSEFEHYRWTKEQIGNANIKYIEELPYKYHMETGTYNLYFQHFFLENGIISEYDVFKKGINQLDFDHTFGIEPGKNNLIFFGHLHKEFKEEKVSTYISVGSAGCEGKYSKGKLADIIEIDKNTYKIKTIGLNWDTKMVINEIEGRKMPDRESIKEYFFNQTPAST